MSDSKRQSLFMTGIVLLVIAGILAYVAFSQPKVYVDDKTVLSKINSTETTDFEITKTQSVSYPLNLNTATYDELITIDGIGEKRAYLIIEYREEIGEYTSVEQIKNISGIGDSTYSRIAGYLTV